MAHNYEVGTRAWQPEPTEGWVASEVKEKLVDGDKVQLVFELENGEVCLSNTIVIIIPKPSPSTVACHELTIICLTRQKQSKQPKPSSRWTTIQGCLH